MAKPITYADLDNALLKPFKADTQDLIRTALRLGWEGNDSSRSLTLKSYDGKATIHLSRSPRNNSGPLKQLRDKIMRYADPMMLAVVDGEVFGKRMPGATPVVRTAEGATRHQQYRMAHKYASLLPAHFKAALVDWSYEDIGLLIADIDRHGIALSEHLISLIADENVDMKVLREYLLEAQQGAPKQEPEAPATPLPPAEEPPKEISLPEATAAVDATLSGKAASGATLISEGPYLSHYTKGDSNGRPGRRYESPIIVERKWSDGTVDYACSFCQRPSESAAGVISHYKKHTNSGEVEKLGKSAYRAGVAALVDDPAYTENVTWRQYPEKEEAPVVEDPAYKPREDRVAALAAEIEQLIRDANGTAPNVLATKLARKALVWVHEQKGNGLSKPPETAEEVLEAIRNLVDRGSYANLQERAEEAEKARFAAEQAAAEAREQAYEMQQRAETAEEKFMRRGEDLRALRELASSLGSD